VFPTDLELCDRFGVSRNTVREAIRALQDSGLIRRQAGSGSIVQAIREGDLYTQKMGSLAALDAYASETFFEKRSEAVIVLKPSFAETLGCPPAGRWLHLTGRRFLKTRAEPLAWTELFIAEPYIHVREKLVAGSEPFYEQLRRLCGVVTIEVEQQISAAAIPPATAQILSVEVGTPALLTRRKYFSGSDEPFEISLSLHPGDRHVYISRLSREFQRLAKPTSSNSHR
jgi:DNA-binding GntR family transcriptional regulator